MTHTTQTLMSIFSLKQDYTIYTAMQPIPLVDMFYLEMTASLQYSL